MLPKSQKRSLTPFLQGVYRVEVQLQRWLPKRVAWWRAWELFYWNPITLQGQPSQPGVHSHLNLDPNSHQVSSTEPTWSSTEPTPSSSVPPRSPAESAPSSTEPTRSSTWQWRWADRNDADLLAQQMPAAVVTQRWQAGGRAFVAVQQHELQAVVWFQSDRYVDLETQCHFQLGPNQWWIFGAWVRRTVRGQGHYSRLLKQALADLSPPHYPIECFLAVDRTNANSRAVHRSLNALPIGTLTGYSLLGLTRWHCSGEIAAAFQGQTNRLPHQPHPATSQQPLIRLDRFVPSSQQSSAANHRR